MGLTVTNTNTMTLLGILNKTEKAQKTVLEQLSTGFKINRGADDPAGLIALKNLQAEITAVDASIANNQRTDAVLGVADNALGEIHSLLQDIETLVVASNSDANISNEERAANQAQIDLAIGSVDRIVRTTAFNGKRLLDGTGTINHIESDTADIQDTRIYNRGNLSSNLTLTVDVTTDAATASFSGALFSGSTTSTSVDIAITGSLGTTTVTVAAGSTAAAAATAINAAKDSTGVSASVSGAAATEWLVYNSTQTGSAKFVSVDVLTTLGAGGGITGAGGFRETTGNVLGTDAAGTVNGQAFTADGTKVSFNVGGVSGAFNVGTSFTAASAAETITVQTTGGFTFQLGSETSTRQTIGIDALFSHKLGSSDAGGYLNNLISGSTSDLSTAANRAEALAIVRDAISDVAVAQGRIGGFQKYQVQPAIANLQAQKVGLSDAASVIGDTDYAVATAELNKQSVLLNSGISLLGLANQQAAQILSLLGA